jgi:hypothetical protein
MKLSILTCLVVLAGAGLASGVAQAADVAVPADKCDAAWSMASPNGETIAKDAATPFVLNFAMMDSNNDGAIDQDEFSKACSAGLVKADEAFVNDMK